VNLAQKVTKSESRNGAKSNKNHEKKSKRKERIKQNREDAIRKRNRKLTFSQSCDLNLKEAGRD